MVMREAMATSIILTVLATLAEAQESVAQEAAKYHESVPKYLLIQRVIKAHGVFMGVAFAFLYPFGGIVIRLLAGRSWSLQLHAWWQLSALLLTTVGFGLGIWLVDAEQMWKSPTGHPIIGTVVVCLLLLLPALGLLHHDRLEKKGRRSVFSYAHIWIARPVLVLGGINGGLGIWMDHDMPLYSIYAYSIVAGIFYIGWWAALAFWGAKGPVPIIRPLATDAEKAELDKDETTKHLDAMKHERTQSATASGSVSSRDAIDSKSIEIVQQPQDAKLSDDAPERYPFKSR